jgi:hypothetical protein
MRAILKTILGLVFDSWWLVGGIFISIVITYLMINNGLDAQISGWLLLIMIIAALILSLFREYKRIMNKPGK